VLLDSSPRPPRRRSRREPLSVGRAWPCPRISFAPRRAIAETAHARAQIARLSHDGAHKPYPPSIHRVGLFIHSEARGRKGLTLCNIEGTTSQFLSRPAAYIARSPLHTQDMAAELKAAARDHAKPHSPAWRPPSSVYSSPAPPTPPYDEVASHARQLTSSAKLQVRTPSCQSGLIPKALEGAEGAVVSYYPGAEEALRACLDAVRPVYAALLSARDSFLAEYQSGWDRVRATAAGGDGTASCGTAAGESSHRPTHLVRRMAYAYSASLRCCGETQPGG